MGVTLDRPADARCPYGVGSLMRLAQDWRALPVGTPGVVCRVYPRPGWPMDGGGAWGLGVVFCDGSYGEFGALTVEQALQFAGEVEDARLARYAFVSATRVAHDFRVGLFDAAFGSAVA